MRVLVKAFPYHAPSRFVLQGFIRVASTVGVSHSKRFKGTKNPILIINAPIVQALRFPKLTPLPLVRRLPPALCANLVECVLLAEGWLGLGFYFGV